ncbi:MAG: ABC transporter permease [Thermoanaerobaculum sp.]
MRARLARRLVGSLFVVWLVATGTFFFVAATPGDVASKLADPRIPPSARARLREHFGLDKPVLARYVRWLFDGASGNLGESFAFRRPVREVLTEAVPNTVLLASVGLLLELGAGVALGLFQALRPGSWGDRWLSALSLAAYAMPTFFMASLLLWLLAYTVPLFPPSHMAESLATNPGLWERTWETARHLALPALTVGLTGFGAVARYLRGSLLDERQQTYILAALARGCSRRRALVVHALPNAVLPLLTILGLSLPFLVSGSLVIEVMFSWPGMGQVFYTAVTARDVPLIQAATVLVTAAVVAGNWLADVVYSLADPRIRQ